MFRCRFWMGRNNSLNNRFGWALTPFAEYNVVKESIAIPVRFKNYGVLEARMIKEADMGDTILFEPMPESSHHGLPLCLSESSESTSSGAGMYPPITRPVSVMVNGVPRRPSRCASAICSSTGFWHARFSGIAPRFARVISAC